MHIGPIKLPNNIILAPMAGVTDLPFRNICRDIGAGAAVGEMLSANQKLWHTRKSQFRQIQKSESGIRWIQILGNDPQQMAAAAQHCEQQGAHIIDINMGCPAKKVCRKAAGSALLQNEALVAKILESVVNAVSIPVTLKIRNGWSREHKNALNIAYIAQESGIKTLTVHGRSRECRYDVKAEYDTVSEIKQAVSIPIIVNGDINSAKKAKTILDQTQADGIMLGRSALGNPWLFRETNHFIQHNKLLPPPKVIEIKEVVLKHIVALHQFYGPVLGVRITRKHLSWYRETFDSLTSIKQRFNKLDSSDAQIRFLEQYFDNLINENNKIVSAA